MQIYKPLDDSYFFSSFLEKYLARQKKKNLSYLDMGTGSGILSEVASKYLDSKNILASDINQKAVSLVKGKGFNAIRSNLFENINDKFDLITFNAPYLPEDKREPKDSRISTTGGKKGDEISIEFLKEAKKYLKKNGKIFLLISSLTPQKKIKKFNSEIVARKKIFSENLLILKFR
jgi:release factor glutamine methyltransferase|tara:strand:- start:3624 stop:4151 length:528 start_codon:yes stop_codon:yes gene_type:complete